jgi:predicted metalloprotease with PDZ domain
MRIPALLPTVFMASVTASALLAQDPRITRIGPGTIVAPGGRNAFYSDEPRAVIGVSTTNGASSRDTLGVLVSSVRAGSPAEKAGLEEGNRIASINGVSLKLAAADVGDDQMAGVMSRRLSRELDKLKPGDEIDLRVYASGQSKSLKVKTIAPTQLYETGGGGMRRDDDRATLGISLATTGSSRDTLGVFVMSVDDGGPAAKAGIEEGTRIASINGVDVRGHRSTDEDDYAFRTSNVRRLERELAKVKPGEDVDLRVYFNGQHRNVKVKAGRWSDTPRRNRSVTIIGGDHMVMPTITTPRISIDGRQIGDEVRRTLESARAGFGNAFPAMTRAFGRIGGRMDW